MQILFFGTEYWLALDSFLCFERSVIHFIQPTSSWPDGLIQQPPRDNRTPVPSPLSVIQSPVLLQDSIVDKVRTLHPATCAIKHALPQQSPVSSLQSPGLQYSVIEVIHSVWTITSIRLLACRHPAHRLRNTIQTLAFLSSFHYFSFLPAFNLLQLTSASSSPPDTTIHSYNT